MTGTTSCSRLFNSGCRNDSTKGASQILRRRLQWEARVLAVMPCTLMKGRFSPTIVEPGCKSAVIAAMNTFVPIIDLTASSWCGSRSLEQRRTTGGGAEFHDATRVCGNL